MVSRTGNSPVPAFSSSGPPSSRLWSRQICSFSMVCSFGIPPLSKALCYASLPGKRNPKPSYSDPSLSCKSSNCRYFYASPSCKAFNCIYFDSSPSCKWCTGRYACPLNLTSAPISRTVRNRNAPQSLFFNFRTPKRCQKPSIFDSSPFYKSLTWRIYRPLKSSSTAIPQAVRYWNSAAYKLFSFQTLTGDQKPLRRCVRGTRDVLLSSHPGKKICRSSSPGGDFVPAHWQGLRRGDKNHGGGNAGGGRRCRAGWQAGDLSEASDCLYVRRTVGDGELVEHSGSIIIFGDVEQRGHVLAGGDIIVLGRLQGHVHAGRAGNTRAKVFATAMEPREIRIYDSALFCPKLDKIHVPKIATFTCSGGIDIQPAVEAAEEVVENPMASPVDIEVSEPVSDKPTVPAFDKQSNEMAVEAAEEAVGNPMVSPVDIEVSGPVSDTPTVPASDNQSNELAVEAAEEVVENLMVSPVHIEVFYKPLPDKPVVPVVDKQSNKPPAQESNQKPAEKQSYNQMPVQRSEPHPALKKVRRHQTNGLRNQRPAQVALVTGLYISIAGIALLGFPKALFGILFDMQGVTLGWVQVGAVLAVVFGVYYIGTAIGDMKGMKGAQAFYISTVVGRMFLFLSFSWLVFTGAVPSPVFLIGTVNLVGALVMLNALLRRS